MKTDTQGTSNFKDINAFQYQLQMNIITDIFQRNQCQPPVQQSLSLFFPIPIYFPKQTNNLTPIPTPSLTISFPPPLTAGDQYRQKAPQLSQSQQVQHLYRKSLKTLVSWTVSREIWLDEADVLRAKFEANSKATPAAASRLLQEGNQLLFEYTHPDKYCIPHMPGGSKFMRNPALPLEVCFPDGKIPKNVNQRVINPDLSTMVEGGAVSGSGQCVVDFTTKTMT